MNHKHAHQLLRSESSSNGRVDRTLASLQHHAGAFIRPFDALAESIAYQQLSAKPLPLFLAGSALSIPKRKWLDPEQLLATPDETASRRWSFSRENCRVKRPGGKNKSTGTVPAGRALIRMSDDEIITRLTAVRGIGRWTVEMLLLFDLGRPDVWPVDDYGVRKGFAKTFGRRKLPTPKTAHEVR
jgi:DNA-3-methyladenine glycosylase II